MSKVRILLKIWFLRHQRLYSALQNFRARWQLFRLNRKELHFLWKFSGGIGELTRKESLETQILLRTHSIEKGLSLRNPRPGFGIPLILELLQYIDRYYTRFPDMDFLATQCAVLDAYLEFHRDSPAAIEPVVAAYQVLKTRIGALPGLRGGVVEFTREESLLSRKSCFGEFAKSRHSLRYFDDRDVDVIGAVRQALELAQCAPSACNRQPQKVYIFCGKAKDELLAYQQGSRAFQTEVNTLLLITAKQTRYCFDIHQPYVDGGLYAMNLLYSLHYYNLGTIPLSVGMITWTQRQELTRKWNIPANEALIMLIAVGGMPEQCHSNLSLRGPVAGVVRVVGNIE